MEEIQITIALHGKITVRCNKVKWDLSRKTLLIIGGERNGEILTGVLSVDILDNDFYD